MKTFVLYVLSCVMFAGVVAGPVIVHLEWGPPWVSIAMVLLFIPAIWLFINATERSYSADGYARGPVDLAGGDCNHCWGMPCEDLAGRQYVRCVKCGAETLLP